METASFCDPNLILRTSSLDSYMNFPINIVGLLHYTIITWKLREQPIIGVLQKYCYKKCRKERDTRTNFFLKSLQKFSQ